MRPILFEWGGIEVHSYPAMLYAGLLFGVTAENYAANLVGMDSWGVFLATIILLIPALVGARLAYVLPRWGRYRRRPDLIWDRSEGGAAMFGGLPLALLSSVPLLAAIGMPFWAFWDVATFTFLTAAIFTRVGCLLNGCCGGRPSSSRFALRLPSVDGICEKRLPTQLLDAGWCAILLVGAAALWGRLPFPGALFLYGIGGYAAGRFFLEWSRDRRRALVWGLTSGQITSLTLLVGSFTLAALNR